MSYWESVNQFAHWVGQSVSSVTQPVSQDVSVLLHKQGDRCWIISCPLECSVYPEGARRGENIDPHTRTQLTVGIHASAVHTHCMPCTISHETHSLWLNCGAETVKRRNTRGERERERLSVREREEGSLRDWQRVQREERRVRSSLICLWGFWCGLKGFSCYATLKAKCLMFGLLVC